MLHSEIWIKCSVICTFDKSKPDAQKYAACIYWAHRYNSVICRSAYEGATGIYLRVMHRTLTSAQKCVKQLRQLYIKKGSYAIIHK